MQKREAMFTTKFKKWAVTHLPELGTYGCEIKTTKGTSISLRAIQEHQLLTLRNMKHGSFGYKIVDCGYQNPLDLIIFRGVGAYVVPSFYTPRKGYDFYIIDIVF